MIRILILFAVFFGLTQTIGLAVDPPVRKSTSPSQMRQGHVAHQSKDALPQSARKAGIRPVAQVRTASQTEVVYEGEAMSDEHVVGEHLGLGNGCASCGGSCGTGDCMTASCGISPYGLDLCNTCQSPRRLCICLPAHGWIQMDYLNWWQSGMNIPTLVTTSPNSGILPTGATVFGNEEILTDSRGGGRVRFGWWFVNNTNVGIEGEYFGLTAEEQSFVNQATGSPLLARPFFNIATGRNDSQIFSSTGLVSGSLTTDALSNLDGAAVRFRRSMCCSSGCDFSWLACGNVPVQSRTDATVGWRYLQLSEQITMTERLNEQTGALSQFDIVDQFKTNNIFNGGELGYVWQGRRGFWSLDTVVRASIGNVNQMVTISGSTRINNVLQTGGGFLTQTSNIGTFERNMLAVLPEFGATLGYQLTPKLRLTAGYTFIMLSNAVRPGDQISLDLNENLLAPAQNLNSQVSRPEFHFVQSDYWIHGVSVGGELRW